MKTHQRTIASPATLFGIGLHSGTETRLTFQPAPENSGVLFVRTDLEDQPEIPANVSYVSDTQRGTTLANENGVQIRTVEHVLSALAGLRIDNCRIELVGEEPPVIDGSSEPFVKALKKVGFSVQESLCSILVVDKPIHYTSKEHNAEFTLLPSDGFSATVILDYENNKIPMQQTTFSDIYEAYERHISSARTFCFLSDVERLREQGLIRGGTIENAIVLADSGWGIQEIKKSIQAACIETDADGTESNIIVGEPLRFPNEPARHKLLDLIGDLSLVGVSIKGHLVALRPGHTANVEFTQHLASLVVKRNLIKKITPDPSETMIDVGGVMKILPHRYPFLLVDRVVSLDKSEGRIVGIKNVTINEPFFEGHFPRYPIMPGVLIVEAMAQTGGMLLMNEIGEDEAKLALFMGIREAKFRRPVVPGDTLQMNVLLKGKRFNTYTLEGKAMVAGKVAAQAEFSLAVMNQTNYS